VHSPYHNPGPAAASTAMQNKNNHRPPRTNTDKDFKQQVRVRPSGPWLNFFLETESKNFYHEGEKVEKV
jgi:hypothetical protein